MNASCTVTIAGIPGSLRQDSFNRRLLQAAAQELPAGVELKVWNGLAHVPAFNEDVEHEPAPAAVAELRHLIETADALLIATPEYNGSIPGQLKNALDWASRPRGDAALEGKRVATMSASPTPYGAAWAQENLRKVLNIIGCDVTGGELTVPQAFRQFDDDGVLLDQELRYRLGALVTELAGSVVSAPIST
jgi:chromate reductase, NAD(P)H dehydrogenase (quinone)